MRPLEGTREPHLILRGADAGYSATAGCERLQGRYRVDGTQIAFDAPDAVGSCPEALRDRQRTLLEVLQAVDAWSIQGQVLELFDAAGAPVAVLEAVYLR
jgi:heat shock protein HslJ